MNKISILKTNCGDSFLLQFDDASILVDCGIGPNYPTILKQNGIHRIDGLILSHDHADHWAGLLQVMPLLASTAWIAKPSYGFSKEALFSQKLFEKLFAGPSEEDVQKTIGYYYRILSRPIPDIYHGTLIDLNIEDSAARDRVQVEPRQLHQHCIVPFLNGDLKILIGTDFEDWDRLLEAGKLPRDIHVFLAPNHGQNHGRPSAEVIQHLNPGQIIISDADTGDNDNLTWYEANCPHSIVRTLRGSPDHISICSSDINSPPTNKMGLTRGKISPRKVWPAN